MREVLCGLVIVLCVGVLLGVWFYNAAVESTQNAKTRRARFLAGHGYTLPGEKEGERVPSAALARKMSRLGLTPGMMKVEVEG